MPSAPVSSMRRTMSRQASGFDSTIAETITARSGQARLTSTISRRFISSGRSRDQLDVVDGQHALPAPAPCAVAIRNVQHRRADGLPHRAAPARLKGLVNLRAGVGGRRRGQPEWIRRFDAGKVDAEICHAYLTSAARVAVAFAPASCSWIAAAASLPSCTAMTVEAAPAARMQSPMA